MADSLIVKIVFLTSSLTLISASLPYERGIAENRKIGITGFALNSVVLDVIANVSLLQQQVKGKLLLISVGEAI